MEPGKGCADAGRTARRGSRPRARTADIAADRSRPPCRAVPPAVAVDQRALEAELLDAALSSCVARSGSCIGRAATPTKRSGRLAISCASTSLASRASSTARLTSGMAWIAGALSDAIMISTPASSIRRSRWSWKSSSRCPSSDQTWAAERLRIAERGLDREMILERDFSLHGFPLETTMRRWRRLCAKLMRSACQHLARRADRICNHECHPSRPSPSVRSAPSASRCR